MTSKVSPLKDAVPQEAQFEGGLLSARHGVVSGWAWDRSDTRRSVEVEIFAEGVRLGRTTANAFDPHQPDWVKGQHSFQCRVSPGLLVPPYAVRARILGSTCELDRAIEVTSQHEHVETLVGYAGTVTGVGGGAIEGWVVSKADSSERVAVELHHQSEVIARTVAGRPMPVAPEYGAGHGFRLPVPLSMLDGAVHRISLKVAGNGFELASSPMSLALLAADGILDRLEQLEVGLERMKRLGVDREARIGTMTEQLGADLSRRFDALLMVQRNAFEQEMSVLRRHLGEDSAVRPAEDRRPASVEVWMGGRVVGYGWHGSEQDDRGSFRWMANSATVVVDFTAPTSARLKLGVHHVLDAIHKETMQVTVNGEPVTASTWKEGVRYLEYEGVVPAAAFRGRSCAVVTLRTEFARIVGQNDPRELSVALSLVRLEPHYQA